MVIRWVLLCGTGRQTGLPDQVAQLAEKFGQALAMHGYGLVVGGWPGVDYLAAKSFAAEIEKKRLPLADYMIQVLSDKRPGRYPRDAEYPDFRGGHIIYVPEGAREWIEALKYADAVVLLGGEGGTLETFYYSIQEQRPVFPVVKTGGDAEKAYRDAEERWELFPYAGYSKADFTQALSQPADTPEQRRQLVHDVMELLKLQFAYNLNTLSEDRHLIFVSYAHEDRQWLVKLRSALRPVERKAKLSVWDDQNLSASDAFQQKISNVINKAKAAILLVSDSFLKSEFIRNYELPVLLHRNGEGSLST